MTEFNREAFGSRSLQQRPVFSVQGTKRLESIIHKYRAHYFIVLLLSSHLNKNSSDSSVRADFRCHRQGTIHKNKIQGRIIRNRKNDPDKLLYFVLFPGVRTYTLRRVVRVDARPCLFTAKQTWHKERARCDESCREIRHSIPVYISGTLLCTGVACNNPLDQLRMARKCHGILGYHTAIPLSKKQLRMAHYFAQFTLYA